MPPSTPSLPSLFHLGGARDWHTAWPALHRYANSWWCWWCCCVFFEGKLNDSYSAWAERIHYTNKDTLTRRPACACISLWRHGALNSSVFPVFDRKAMHTVVAERVALSCSWHTTPYCGAERHCIASVAAQSNEPQMRWVDSVRTPDSGVGLVADRSERIHQSYRRVERGPIYRAIARCAVRDWNLPIKTDLPRKLLAMRPPATMHSLVVRCTSALSMHCFPDLMIYRPIWHGPW